METIFEATARIIEREGPAALNTNRIAERAGISIGTLYEYFPNKDAILIAMARRQLAADEEAVRAALSEALQAKSASVPRTVIHTLAKLHTTRPKVRRAIMTAHLASGLANEHARPVQQIAELVTARSNEIFSGRARPVSDASLFVATRAVIGVLRSAFEERPALLEDAAFEDELVALVDRYIAPFRPPDR